MVIGQAEVGSAWQAKAGRRAGRRQRNVRKILTKALKGQRELLRNLRSGFLWEKNRAFEKCTEQLFFGSLVSKFFLPLKWPKTSSKLLKSCLTTASRQKKSSLKCSLKWSQISLRVELRPS